MYSVKHNDVFIAVVATSFGHHDHHQAHDIQNLKRRVTCNACTTCHHQFLSLLVEHRAYMKSFQGLRSPAIPLTSFRDLPVFLISSSIVLRHILFSLPFLLYPWGFQYTSNTVFSIVPVSSCNVCPVQFHFLLFI